DEFLAWGYTAGFAVMVGIAEILGAVGLLVKRTAGWAALGLMVIMLGAIWTHVTHREYVAMISPLVAFAVLGFVVWGRGLTWETRPAHEPAQICLAPAARKRDLRRRLRRTRVGWKSNRLGSRGRAGPVRRI